MPLRGPASGGQAYGNVLDTHPELRAQTLHCEVTDVFGAQTIHLDGCFFTVVARNEGRPGVKSAKIFSTTLEVVSRGEARDWDFPISKTVVRPAGDAVESRKRPAMVVARGSSENSGWNHRKGSPP